MLIVAFYRALDLNEAMRVLVLLSFIGKSHWCLRQCITVSY